MPANFKKFKVSQAQARCLMKSGSHTHKCIYHVSLSESYSLDGIKGPESQGVSDCNWVIHISLIGRSMSFIIKALDK